MKQIFSRPLLLALCTALASCTLDYKDVPVDHDASVPDAATGSKSDPYSNEGLDASLPAEADGGKFGDHGGDSGPLDTESFIEITRDGKTQRLMAPCGKWAWFPFPYAEVIDPSASSVRLVVDTCGASEVYFSFVASLVVHAGDDLPDGQLFPSDPEVLQLGFSDPDSGQEWSGENAKVHLTALGEVGEYVDGTFSADMPGDLSHPAGRVTGRFHTPRQVDRFSP